MHFPNRENLILQAPDHNLYHVETLLVATLRLNEWLLGLKTRQYSTSVLK